MGIHLSPQLRLICIARICSTRSAVQITDSAFLHLQLLRMVLLTQSTSSFQEPALSCPIPRGRSNAACQPTSKAATTDKVATRSKAGLGTATTRTALLMWIYTTAPH